MFMKLSKVITICAVLLTTLVPTVVHGNEIDPDRRGSIQVTVETPDGEPVFGALIGVTKVALPGEPLPTLTRYWPGTPEYCAVFPNSWFCRDENGDDEDDDDQNGNGDEDGDDDDQNGNGNGEDDEDLPEVFLGTTDALGNVVFEDLTQGVWLVTALSSVEIDGELVENPFPVEYFFNPFFVRIPQWQNGQPVFDVTVVPKTFIELPDPDGDMPALPTYPTEPEDETEPEREGMTPVFPSVPQMPEGMTPTAPTIPTGPGRDPSEPAVTAPTVPTMTEPARMPNLPQTGMTIMGFSGIGLTLTAAASALIAKKRQSNKE